MPETYAEYIAMLRRFAQEYSDGTRPVLPSAEAGRLLGLYADKLEEWVADFDVLRADVRDWHQDIAVRLAAHDAELDVLRALAEDQCATIEALLEENDLLRAQLYTQDRKGADA